MGRGSGLRAAIAAGWLLLASLVVPALAQGAGPGLTLLATTPKHGVPGEFVTVPFVAQGTGTFRFSVSAPVGWSVVSPQFTQTVSGKAVLLVTVQVGPGAAPGVEHRVTLAAFQAGRRVVTATQDVRVDKSAAVALRAPGSVQALPGQTHSFDVVVRNDGNFRDTFAVYAKGTIFPVAVAPHTLTLEPGASGAVRLTVTPSGTVSNGFSQLIIVKVVSAFDNGATDQARVSDEYVNPALPNPYASPGKQGPHLVFGVDSLAAGTLLLSDQKPEGTFKYELTPSLHGALSDYVTGSVATAPISGDQRAPIPSVQGASVEIAGSNWDATASAGLDSAQLGATAQLDKWALAGSGTYAWRNGAYGARVRADRQGNAADFRVTGSTQRVPYGGGVVGNDTLGVRLERDLGGGFSGQLGVSGLGLLQPGGAYRVVPRLHEQLSWQGQALDALESYSGQPTLGLHTITVTGGTRTLTPLGARTRSVLQLDGRAYSLSSSIGLYGGAPLSAADRFGATLSQLSYHVVGGLELGTSSGTTPQFSVEPGIGWDVVRPGSVSAYVNLDYKHQGGLRVGAAADTFRASASLVYRNLAIDLLGSYARSYGTAVGHDNDTRAQVDAVYTPSSRTQFAAKYGYERSLQPAIGGYVAHDIGKLDWQEQWTLGLSTDVAYKLDLYPHVAALSTNSLGLSATYAPVVLPGLDVQGSYELGSPFGQLSASQLTHHFTLRVGYALAVGFKTPKAVVDAFGGRKTGLVQGRAFVQSAGGTTKPVAGLEIELGDTTITTDHAGRFSARVPVGRYDVRFGAGLPATMGYFGNRLVTVKRNETVRLELPFQPVGSIRLFLFDDANRNGTPDKGEHGIPYGGVQLQGPVQRTVTVDDHGRALVTGLPAGRYTIAPDPARLPTDYVSTGRPATIDLAPGERGVAVSVGAALPPPTIVTTFQPGTLSLYVQATPQNVPAGADVNLDAQVNGTVDRVAAELDGRTVQLRRKGGTWVASPRIALDTPPGPLTIAVTASHGSHAVSQKLTVNIVRGDPFRAPIFSVTAGSRGSLDIHTLFKAQRVEVRLPGGDTVRLTSSDGYHWSGAFMAPATPGVIQGTVLGNDQTIGTVRINVMPHASGGGH